MLSNLYPRYDLALERDASGRYLPWIIALMAYLATLAMAGGLLLQSLSQRWQSQVVGSLTVEISALAPAGAPSLPERVAGALELLHATPGISSAEPLSDEGLRKLLEPWLGNDIPLDSLPVPRLIEIERGPGDALDTEALAKHLSETVPGAKLDDHGAWLHDLRRLVTLIEAIAIAIVGLIGGAAVIAVIFAARTGLAVHAPVIELLHIMGATDAYVARQFQGHMLGLALAGGTIGLLLSWMTLLGLSFAAASLPGNLAPATHLGLWGTASLALVPLVLSLLAMLTTRFTVLKSLARLP